MRNRIAVIGAGNVGGEAARYLLYRQVGDVVLLDKEEGKAQGKALDLCQATPVVSSSYRVTGTDSYEEVRDSDVVIITAGKPRKPGMDREELLKVNLDIVGDVSRNVAEVAPNAVVIVVSNPLDAMVYAAALTTGFPRSRVIGMAGQLDCARFSYFLSDAVGVSPADVQATVLGTHGDLMVPVLSYTTVNGIPITHFLTDEKLAPIVERTRKGGGEIVKLMGTSAWYAPGDAACALAEAVLYDTDRVLCASAYLEGQYGVSGTFIGVPIVVGAGGVKRVIELDLAGADKEAFARSAEHIGQMQREVDGLHSAASAS